MNILKTNRNQNHFNYINRSDFTSSASILQLMLGYSDLGGSFTGSSSQNVKFCPKIMPSIYNYCQHSIFR